MSSLSQLQKTCWRAMAVSLAACGLASCVHAPTLTQPSTLAIAPLSASTVPLLSPSSTPQQPGYEFPAAFDPARRYLFYLHGKIIEDQGLPAVSPEFGAYEYTAILEKLASHGFIVISEQRPKNTDGYAYAQKIAGQIATLLNAQVPAGHISVVGASKGAAITVFVSDLLKNQQVNYVLLGTCHPDTIAEWKRRQVTLYGNVLAIHDYADQEYSGSCQEMFQLSTGKGLARHDEIVLRCSLPPQNGGGHGALYKPLDEWLLPAVQWSNSP